MGRAPFIRGQAREIVVCPCLYLKENYMEQLLQVGVITQTHGVRGEVKVFPTTDDAILVEKWEG